MLQRKPRREIPYFLAVTLAWIAGSCCDVARGEPSAESGRSEFSDIRQTLTERGVLFLQSTQLPDGSYRAEFEPAFAAIATTAMLRNGVAVDDPHVAAGLRFLRGFVREDGGIYRTDSKQRNYETCLAAMCFSAAREHSDAATAREYRDLLARTAEFLKHYQWDADENIPNEDYAFGGFGYGSHERPDLSNTSFALDTLRELGVSPSDESFRQALIFLSRCQNLPSEHNQTPFASKISDGGFYYTPAAGGNSQAGTDDNGGLRSYASMTYAGLRSMIHAGLEPSDPRIVAARKWLANHYSIEQNPGLGEQGLYYYYHTLAKTMALSKEPRFTDSSGKEHDWKSDLVHTLSHRQRSDGAWVNNHPRWLEDDPILVTSYALLALAYCNP